NMRTLDWLPPEKRSRIAQETRDLYAPLVHRFGMAKLRWELEDLAFKHLETDEYKSLAKKVSQKRGEREALIKQLREPLETALARAGTRDMHRTADFGIAAHWRYKEDAKTDELDKHLSWFRQVIELQMDARTPDEFLEFLKLDLYQDEIFVFTPTGDVIQLPKGATPIDFAFAVHTEVGLHCQGARINGRIASLARELKNSETVEIITSPSAKPSRDWLAHVRTGRA